MIVRAEHYESPALNRPVTLFRMSSGQFAALPESEQQLELLNGEVVLSPRARPPHQQFVGRLFAILDPWVETHQLGAVYPDVEMRLDDDWTPAPDLLFVTTDHLGRVEETQVIG